MSETLTIASLFDDPPIIVERPLTLEERFLVFHRANPHVYESLKQLALDLVNRGHETIGIGMIYEVCRWQQYLRTSDPQGFKLNNDFRAPFARMLMRCEPRLANVFEIRHSKVDSPL